MKTTVQLACASQPRVVTTQVCRSISLSRGFRFKDADAICKPARGECQKDGTCRQCVDDLERLDYRGSHHVCRALTYVPDAARARVVVIRDSGAGADSTRASRSRAAARPCEGRVPADRPADFSTARSLSLRCRTSNHLSFARERAHERDLGQP